MVSSVEINSIWHIHGSKQGLPLQVKVYLEVMTKLRYFTFFKAPGMDLVWFGFMAHVHSLNVKNISISDNSV